MNAFVLRVEGTLPAEGVELLEAAGFEVFGGPLEYMVLGLEALDRDEAIEKARDLVEVAMIEVGGEKRCGRGRGQGAARARDAPEGYDTGPRRAHPKA